MVIQIDSTEYKESFDEVLGDGVNRMLGYYVTWRTERDKMDHSPDEFDASAEELLRENLISKVIAIQQLFEQPKRPKFRTLWTEKRLTMIKNMGQIQAILKMMNTEKKKKKRKSKKPKVNLIPVANEKQKPLPEGFINTSKLLPRVDMKSMETRSFRWSRERETSLIDIYVEKEHMKQQAILEHRTGLRPILKIDFTEITPLPISTQWTKLPMAKYSLELEDEPNTATSPKPPQDPQKINASRAPSRLSVQKSRQNSARKSVTHRDSMSVQSTTSRKGSKNMLSIADMPDLKPAPSNISSKRGSKAMGRNSLMVPGLNFEAIDEESVFDYSDTDTTNSPSIRRESISVRRTSRFRERQSRLGNRSAKEDEPDGIGTSDSRDGDVELRPELIEIDRNRYYRNWWKKKKNKRKLTFVGLSDDEISDDNDEQDSEKLQLTSPNKSLRPSPPPKNTFFDIHKTFLHYNPDHCHAKEDLEQIRKRRLEELFLKVKLFVSAESDDERSNATTSRRQTKKK